MKKVLIWGIPAIAILVVAWFLLAPPRFWLNLTRPVDMSDPVAAGQALVVKYDCRSCHQIQGEGRPFGPNLDGATRRLDSVSLRMWLRDPKGIKPDTSMPGFHLSDNEVEAIIAYLQAVDSETLLIGPETGIY